MFWDSSEKVIDGIINAIETVDNKKNITVDLFYNISEYFEKINTEEVSKDKLIDKFKSLVTSLENTGCNVTYKIYEDNDKPITMVDYRRDLNYNYCKKVDYVMWGETDSFFPKEALQSLEVLSQYTKQQGIHRYITCFADRKMWDSSWDATVHRDYLDVEFVDDENQHKNLNQAKSPLPIETMNEINSKVDEFDIMMIDYQKIDGSCLVLSSDLIKFGVNIPSCMIYNDDHGLSIMAQKLLGKDYKQYIIKNLLKVHARRHPKKRMYVLEENNPNSFSDKKKGNFQIFKSLSDKNIQTLVTSSSDKFYEYKDFNKLIMEKK